MRKAYEMMRKAGQWLASFGADRYLHLLAGLAVCSIVARLMAAHDEPRLGCVGVAMMVTVAVGMGKEIADQCAGEKGDAVDWLFTCVGGVIGGLLWLA